MTSEDSTLSRLWLLWYDEIRKKSDRSDQGASEIRQAGDLKDCLTFDGDRILTTGRWGIELLSNLEICGMNEFQYYVFFHPFRTAFSDHQVREAAHGGWMAYARMDDQPVGYLCASAEGDRFRASFGFTHPAYRNQGILTALMMELIRTGDRPVRLCLPEKHPFAVPVRAACRFLGFVQGESVHVFSCRRDTDEPWRNFMTHRGKRLCDTLDRYGYRTVSFSEAGSDLLDQLRESPRTLYRNRFYPADYLDGRVMGLSRELSFAAIREGRLSAYSLVRTENREIAVFEQISVSAQEKGKGVILLPFVSSMNAFFRGDYKQAYYAMYASNSSAQAFRVKILHDFPAGESVLENYYFPGPEGKCE